MNKSNTQGGKGKVKYTGLQPCKDTLVTAGSYYMVN
jgi:hypothetical protein